MNNLFPKLLFGLLAGDYLLQPKEMATRKQSNSLICIYHCLIVTIISIIFLQEFSSSIICLIFLSHYIIDRYSLATWWLFFIKGRNIGDANNEKCKYREINICFSCIVYVIVDNTLHLLILYYGIPFLLKGI